MSNKEGLLIRKIASGSRMLIETESKEKIEIRIQNNQGSNQITVQTKAQKSIKIDFIDAPKDLVIYKKSRHFDE